MGQLFISHTNEDADAAARIVTYLEGRGVPCWISSRDIPPRAIYADAITEAMQGASACAVLITKTANQSKAMKRELELASHYDKPFIPILVDGAEPAAGFDYYLRNTQWVDYARDGEHALNRIVTTVQSVPTTAQGAPAPAPVSAARHGMAAVPVIAVLVLAVVAAVGWYVWTRGGDPAPSEEAATADPDVTPLTGSYQWDGIECGDGPTVTLEDATLVFTTPETETYRHTVLSAEPDAGGYALRVETRVTEPAASEGETYVLGMHADMSLDVITGGETNSWQRCPG
jgi:hypothetical protein